LKKYYYQEINGKIILDIKIKQSDMKTLKYILSFALIFFISCSDDLNDINFVDNIQAPANVSAQFLITQDNTGLVTITPNSEGGVSYIVTFGDGSSNTASLNQGESIQHTYPEGTYSIGIEATGITGLKTAITQDLVVSFRAPENIEINAVIDSANPFVMNVSATADFATSFLVYFDTSNENEEPTPLGLEGSVSYEYPSVGDFTIKVVALSGGTATSESTQVVTISSPVELPIDFEIFDASVFQGFGGAYNAVIDNPDTNGNTSSTVGQIVKGAPEVWAGNVITLSSPIDFSTKNAIKMDVWSPRPGGKVLLKLENLDDGGIFYEVEATTQGNSAWETVTFDVSGIDLSKTYQKVVLFFDIGISGDGSADWTFYIDNIRQDFLSEGAFAKLMVEDFEGAAELLPFGNATAEIVELNDLPAGSGTVTDNVAQFTKVNGAEFWAGVTRELSTPLDIATYSNISVKTWSPKVGAVVKLKIENADASITHEVDMNTTVSNTWEVLKYDFSGAPAADYVRVVVFFDFGVTGDDSVYYYDNIELSNNGTPPTVFEDFETIPALIPFGNAASEVITLNDLPSGLGIVTANVAQFNKVNGAEFWAGVTRELNQTIDLGTYNKISLKTWSPKVGAVVKVKIENADASITHEVDMNTTISDAWEELVYDFSGAPAADYVRVVVFFDFGVTGDDSVYYFDDYTLTN
jgi:hypothetical protein